MHFAEQCILPSMVSIIVGNPWASPFVMFHVAMGCSVIWRAWMSYDVFEYTFTSFAFHRVDLCHQSRVGVLSLAYISTVSLPRYLQYSQKPKRWSYTFLYKTSDDLMQC